MLTTMSTIYLYNFSLNRIQEQSLYTGGDDDEIQIMDVKQKWPSLFVRYSFYFDQNFGLTTFTNKRGNEFILVIKSSTISSNNNDDDNFYDKGTRNLIYDLKRNKETYQKWKYILQESNNNNENKILGPDSSSLLPTREPNRFYQFVFRQMKNEIVFDHVLYKFEIHHNRTEFHQIDQELIVCIKLDQLLVLFSHHTCSEWSFIHWFMHGFIHHDQLYLFGIEMVYIIPAKALTELEVEHHFIKKSYQDWIRCEQVPGSRIMKKEKGNDNKTTKENNNNNDNQEQQQNTNQHTNIDNVDDDNADIDYDFDDMNNRTKIFVYLLITIGVIIATGLVVVMIILLLQNKTYFGI